MVLETSDLLYSLFVLRNDVYAEQYLNKGKKAFRKIDGVLTPQLILEHLNGNRHLGVYQLSKDSKVIWGCLDFDENTVEDFEKAKTLYEFALSKGFHPCFEFSGGGDYKVHILFFSQEPIPAKQMKLFLENLCKEINISPHEIFPKQDEIPKGEYGNLLKLPLGINLTTGSKSFFIKSGYEKITLEGELEEKLKVLLSHKDIIPINLEPVKNVITNSSYKEHKWDSFFSQTLKQNLPEGISKEVKIGTREAGINNNLLKNQARWFFEKGYSEELLKAEIKPIFDSNNWAFNDLLGWFHKAEKGQILEINEKELREWIKNYYPSLEFYLPNKNEKRNIESESIPVYTYLDFEKLKADKSFIVQDFLKPDSVTMVYSPPAKFKTILMQGLGMSIATGREWLNLKTKKCPVLYCDGENSNQRNKETFLNFYQGMKLKRKNFPFYVIKSGLLMDSKKNINLGFSVFLERLIEEKGIKVLFFDTLHRFAYYDENKSDDTNKIYTEIFKPLKEKYHLAIIFLHHSTKENGNNNPVYRGSGDFLGMVDCCYRIAADKTTKKFSLINEKNRSGEIETINGQIMFEENFIKLERLGQEIFEKETKGVFLEHCEKIISCFDRQSELSRKDIMEYLAAIKYNYSRATFDRALKWLVEKKESLDKTQKGKYILKEQTK